MIAVFIADRMSRYLDGGMNAETAARFTRGELMAIYQRNHYSRDKSGVFQITSLPENIYIPAAMKKCDEAIAEILNRNKAPEKSKSVYQGSAAIKKTLAAGIPLKDFYVTGKDKDPTAYTSNLNEIAALWKQGVRRYKAFVRGLFMVIDIDRKPGKADGLESLYKLFPPEVMPLAFRDIPGGSFPCYTQTPSGGFHLYFRYDGPELKLRELVAGVEIIEWQITAPGSEKETGPYILHGDFDNAPPLYGLIIDAIEETRQKREREKEERSRPRKRPTEDRLPRFTQPRTSLDDLADEAVSAYGGHHDRQVSFAGRACRCKFSGADTLAYVKARPDIFGSGSDTESTILSVFQDNGCCL
jgi:hypothetical protein